MNQIATQQERLPMDSVGITTGSTGSKIAPQNLGEVVKFAEVMCRADIALPKHLRGNAGACMAVALQALDWQMNPFAVASKSYSVNGQIAYEAQLIVAVVNTRSGIEGRIKYRFEGEGPDRVCIASGKLDGEEFEVRSPKLKDITPKNSPLWKSDPDQQQCYYTGRSWARRFTPEVILGVYDRDEVEQFQGPDNAKNITPAFDPFADDAIVPAQQVQSEVLDSAAASTAPASKSAPVIEYDDITDTGESSQALPDTDDEGSASIPEPSDEEVAGVTSPPAPATSDNPERDMLIKYARDVLPRAADPNVQIAALNAIEKRWLQQIGNLTADGQAKAEVIAKSMRAIVNGKTSLESAATYFADVLDTTQAVIMGKEEA